MNQRRQLCNTTGHCSLCPSEGPRNWTRVRLGYDSSRGPSIAVCPVHDIAGPADLLPELLRVALDRRHA